MTSVPAAAPLTVPGASTSGPLPRARNVLVVTARPGQESASLGGLLYAFRRAGACLGLLCLTPRRGLPAELHLERAAGSCPALGAATGRQRPGHVLGRGGQLPRRQAPQLPSGPAYRTGTARHPPAFPGPAGSYRSRSRRPRRRGRRHGRVRRRQAGRPAVAHTGPGVEGAWTIELGADAATARAIQKSAAAAHAGQSQALPELMRRLEQLDGREHVRWLVSPHRRPEHHLPDPCPL